MAPFLLAAARLAVLLAVLQPAVGSRNLQQGGDMSTQPVNNNGMKPTGPNAGKFKAATDSSFVVQDRYLVQLTYGSSATTFTADAVSAADARIQSIATEPMTILDFPDDIKIRVVPVASNNAQRALQALVDDPAVAIVTPDTKVNASAMQSVRGAWGLDRLDAPDWRQYTYASTGAGTVAYIIDTGIWTTHSEFTDRMLPGVSFVPGNSDPMDDYGHGTHCAGTVGGTVYGVAKKVKLVPVKVLNYYGSGTAADVISGVNWAVKSTYVSNCRKVISMSLGGSSNTLLDNAVAAAYAKGITVVVAAGNNYYDACYYSPARVPVAITVAATDMEDKKAYFSNYGTCVDIFAPGVDIISAYYNSDTSFTTMSGTSMATPHVAGLAARIISTFPGCPTCTGMTNPAQCVWSLIKSNALVGVVSSPFGSPNLLANLAKTK